MEDTVIAASPDGIIVCKKKYTEDIKKAVDNLTPRPIYEERRWGTYRVIDDSLHMRTEDIPLPRASLSIKANSPIRCIITDQKSGHL